MQRNFHETYELQEISPPSERSTGLVFAAVAALVAAFWHATPAVCVTAMALAFLLGALGILSPALLRPLNLIWHRIATRLNRALHPLVVIAMYTLAIIPMGLIMRLTGDRLRGKRDTASATYWVAKDQPGSMENQF